MGNQRTNRKERKTEQLCLLRARKSDLLSVFEPLDDLIETKKLKTISGIKSVLTQITKIIHFLTYLQWQPCRQFWSYELELGTECQAVNFQKEEQTESTQSNSKTNKGVTSTLQFSKTIIILWVEAPRKREYRVQVQLSRCMERRKFKENKTQATTLLSDQYISACGRVVGSQYQRMTEFLSEGLER